MDLGKKVNKVLSDITWFESKLMDSGIAFSLKQEVSDEAEENSGKHYSYSPQIFACFVGLDHNSESSEESREFSGTIMFHKDRRIYRRLNKLREEERELGPVDIPVSLERERVVNLWYREIRNETATYGLKMTYRIIGVKRTKKRVVAQVKGEIRPYRELELIGFDRPKGEFTI